MPLRRARQNAYSQLPAVQTQLYVPLSRTIPSPVIGPVSHRYRWPTSLLGADRRRDRLARAGEAVRGRYRSRTSSVAELAARARDTGDACKVYRSRRRPSAPHSALVEVGHGFSACRRGFDFAPSAGSPPDPTLCKRMGSSRLACVCALCPALRRCVHACARTVVAGAAPTLA